MDQLVLRFQGLLVIYGLRVLAAVAILIFGLLSAKLVRGFLKRVLKKGHIEDTLVSFIASLSYVFMIIFVIIAALSQLGVQTASFVAILGAAGLAVGLALQGSLSNFASGFLLIMFKPFKVGDYIEGAGVAGSVEQIGIFTTELKSPDNKRIIVPNGKITNDNIINYTAREIRRVDIIAGVSYSDDLDKVKRVLKEILDSDERVLEEPAPVIGVLELGDSSVNFVVRPWTKTTDYWNVFFSLQETIKKRFDAEGISIPFPQRDLHIHKVNSKNKEEQLV
ncbi:mechanosensitive ion channel [Chitinispirillales bacterium ANBcel5]|uniref:mechanosensitive ion channel family protein n=1 Tax=Cellulosispirillum alkaliphilum TaxID=3039283 RepID=UPI002A523F29|nr:mechanosensitive ion channel [Chitinispirillales bacterium ANBcel5]